MGNAGVTNLDLDTTKLGVALSNLDQTLVTATFIDSNTITSTEIQAFTAGVNFIGNWLITRKEQKEAKQSIEKMQKYVPEICKVLETDLGYLRGEVNTDYNATIESVAGVTGGVWTGRVDGTPRPGAFGRATAAPLMLDIFGLLPPEEPGAPAPPPGAILADATGELPLGLRRLGGFAADRQLGPSLDYPPSGSTVELTASAKRKFAPVELRVAGGTPPFRWVIYGVPVAGSERRLPWVPDGPGTVRITVVDTDDASAHGLFQLERPAD